MVSQTSDRYVPCCSIASFKARLGTKLRTSRGSLPEKVWNRLVICSRHQHFQIKTKKRMRWSGLKWVTTNFRWGGAWRWWCMSLTRSASILICLHPRERTLHKYLCACAWTYKSMSCNRRRKNQNKRGERKYESWARSRTSDDFPHFSNELRGNNYRSGDGEIYNYENDERTSYLRNFCSEYFIHFCGFSHFFTSFSTSPSEGTWASDISGAHRRGKCDCPSTIVWWPRARS